ncbi:MAG: CvpA family protein [Clostridiales bacterium]|nr:CvpA family protein [Clostridiales bacterium]
MMWVDVLLGAVFIISTISGYIKGFVKTLFSIASYIMAYLFSQWYYRELAEWIRVNTKLNERIESFINIQYSGEISALGTEKVVEGSYGSQIWGIIEKHTIGNVELQKFAQQSIENAKLEIVESVANFLLNIFCILIIFFAVRILILIVGNLINKIFELPILGRLNRITGGLLGALRGVLYIAIIVTIFFLIATYFPDGVIAIALERSKLVQIFLEDIVLKLISLN